MIRCPTKECAKKKKKYHPHGVRKHWRNEHLKDYGFFDEALFYPLKCTAMYKCLVCTGRYVSDVPNKYSNSRLGTNNFFYHMFTWHKLKIHDLRESKHYSKLFRCDICHKLCFEIDKHMKCTHPGSLGTVTQKSPYERVMPKQTEKLKEQRRKMLEYFKTRKRGSVKLI